jgi:hypothetical protein
MRRKVMLFLAGGKSHEQNTQHGVRQWICEQRSSSENKSFKQKPG